MASSMQPAGCQLTPRKMSAAIRTRKLTVVKYYTQNANEKNLITGTRYFNVEGMLPFENRVARYLWLSGNHVLYRVTPIFEGKNLVASGVEMEAWSVEDDGENICFNVFVYNVQPGIEINYKTGESEIEK